MRVQHHQSKRYLGLELAGSKNSKTTLAVLEFYPKEKKVFLLDLFDQIGPNDEKSGDEVLIELINDLTSSYQKNEIKLGVNVPMHFPPCLNCKKKTCSLKKRCMHPTYQWVKDFLKKIEKTDPQIKPVKEYIPYTQRPIELWLRHAVLSQIPDRLQFEIDECLGGNKAPLTARMVYLLKYLKKTKTIEILPKLSTCLIAQKLNIPIRFVEKHRKLEDGIEARTLFLDLLCKEKEIFIYEKDLQNLAKNLSSFDAFICAYTALLSDLNECEKPPKGFPKSSGWIEYPHV